MNKFSDSQQVLAMQFDWRKIVAFCIKSRKNQKLTCEDISKISGLPIQVILDFEERLTNLSIETLFKIISPLNIDIAPGLEFLDWESFVREIVQHRKALGYTLEYMQLSASVSYKVIKKFETGDKSIQLNQVLPILKVLNISQSRRFNEKPDRESHITRQKRKYDNLDVPKASHTLLEWSKIIELCIDTRHQQNMTQDDLAKKAYVSRPTIVNFESGITKINMASVFKIFDALNLDEYLNAADRVNYFSILEWKNFIKVALDRKEDLCLSRNELSKIADIQFPIVTKFEKAETNLSLNSVMKILGALQLIIAPS